MIAAQRTSRATVTIDLAAIGDNVASCCAAGRHRPSCGRSSRRTATATERPTSAAARWPPGAAKLCVATWEEAQRCGPTCPTRRCW